jgi:hypothetical protein
MRYFLAMLAVFGAGLGVAGVATADAPPCAAFDTCRYMPNPYYDGPLLQTWNVPGTYGGWTTLPVRCDPLTYSCQTYVPELR